MLVLKICSEHKKELQDKGVQNVEEVHRKEFLDWFHLRVHDLRQIGSSTATDDLYALASRPSSLVTLYSGCVINGVKWLTYGRDSRRKTQNSGVSVPGTEENTFYGRLEEILEFSYIMGRRIILFKCKWFDTDPRKKRVINDKNITSIFINAEWYKDDPFILASQAQQVFYIPDPLNGRNWSVVHTFTHRHVWDIPENDKEEDQSTPVRVDFFQENNSSNFILTVDLGDLELLPDNSTNVEAEIVSVNIASSSGEVPVEDDFINDNVDVDETLEDYVEDEEEEEDTTDEESTENEQLEDYDETDDD